jgi:pyruvate dehydrogenase E1 component
LIGGTAGRTTLNGEGLQHQDGHSHLLADTIPNCVTYDPTFGYELAVIIHHGLQRMYRDNQDVYFYITTMNENYDQPAMPEGVEQGIIQGMYLLSKSTYKSKHHVQLLGSGTILRESLAAQALLEADFNVAADVWSVTSFNQLKRDAQACQRHNQFHYEEPAKVPYVTTCLEKTKGPVIASTDYMKAFAEQIRAFVPNDYYVLGTDGFGRSDSRSTLRNHFEVDRHYIVYMALLGLVEQKTLPVSVLKQAIEKYALNVNKPDPLTV